MKEIIKGWTNGFSWKTNIYRALLLRLLISMALFSICRIGFYLYNRSFFPEIGFKKLLGLLGGGLVFDLATVLYINLLYVFLFLLPFNFRFHRHFKIGVKYLFFVTNGLAIGANVSDFIYYRFTLKRTTAEVFAQFSNETNMAGLWLKFFVDYWYAALFFILAVVLMIRLYNGVSYTGPQLNSKKTYYISGILAIPLVVYLMIGGMRGGFRHSTRPITLSNAGEYVKNPKHISIVLNTPFAIMRTVGKTKVKKVNYYPPEEVSEIYSPVHHPADSGKFKPKNVVVIILESFSREFIGFYNRDRNNGTYTGYTPFLDSLLQQSLTFEYSFANGRKSIDGLPSVVSSIPSIGVPYFLSPHSANKINSLASLLKKKGYHSSFFHGAPNGSMGFKAFMNIAGVDEYYGMDEYNNDADFDGLWGIWDEPFLQFYARKLNTFKEPFFSSFFSVSSHHPFRVPEAYEETFKGGPLVIHRCIQYTDYSLRRFFEQISKSPWYENTLFVITADHTSSEMEFADTKTAWGFHSVPVLFFTPDRSLQGVRPGIVQQIDIMPSVLGYLHFDEPFVAFGRNVFAEEGEPFAFFYKDENYQLCQGDFLLQFNGSRTVALYDFKRDPLLQQNLLESRPEIVERLERRIKAIVQQYNNRMVEDNLTLD